MEIGDIINLLLILGFAIGAPLIGFIAKKFNKDQNIQKQNNQVDKDQNERGFESLSEQYYNERGLQNQKDVNSNNIRSNPSKSDYIKDEKSDQAEKTAYQVNEESNNNKSNNKYLKDSGANKIAKEFDLRKAVIYSEIMDRKYF